jgi:hypothetical protein
MYRIVQKQVSKEGRTRGTENGTGNERRPDKRDIENLKDG